MTELTQAELEALEIETQEAERRFVAAVHRGEGLAAREAYWRWIAAARRLFEARRARRACFEVPADREVESTGGEDRT